MWGFTEHKIDQWKYSCYFACWMKNINNRHGGGKQDMCNHMVPVEQLCVVLYDRKEVLTLLRIYFSLFFEVLLEIS